METKSVRIDDEKLRISLFKWIDKYLDRLSSQLKNAGVETEEELQWLCYLYVLNATQDYESSYVEKPLEPCPTPLYLLEKYELPSNFDDIRWQFKGIFNKYFRLKNLLPLLSAVMMRDMAIHVLNQGNYDEFIDSMFGSENFLGIHETGKFFDKGEINTEEILRKFHKNVLSENGRKGGNKSSEGDPKTKILKEMRKAFLEWDKRHLTLQVGSGYTTKFIDILYKNQDPKNPQIAYDTIRKNLSSWKEELKSNPNISD